MEFMASASASNHKIPWFRVAGDATLTGEVPTIPVSFTYAATLDDGT